MGVFGDLRFELFQLGLLFGGGGAHQRDGVADAAVFADFGDVVEEGEELVVVALRDRVELVVVAAGAFDREAEPGRADGADAVGDVFDAVLLVDDAAFGVDDVVAAEAGGDALIERRRWAAGRRRAAR